MFLSSSQNPFEGYLVEARASNVSGEFDPTSTIWGEWITNGSDLYHGVMCNRSSTDSSEGLFFVSCKREKEGEGGGVSCFMYEY